MSLVTTKLVRHADIMIHGIIRPSLDIRTPCFEDRWKGRKWPVVYGESLRSSSA